MRANAKALSKNHKSAILLWLGGGPPSIDMWDMKPGAATAGEFKPISTTGDFQICELMPELAKQGKHLSIVRSMSTREADHERGRYYMHTAYVPNPNVEHPGYGSVVAHELESKRPELEIPPFVSIGGRERRAGVLGNDVRAVSGRCERADQRCLDERARAADERSDEALRRAGDAVHQRAARLGGGRACQGAAEDARLADERADERV